MLYKVDGSISFPYDFSGGGGDVEQKGNIANSSMSATDYNSIIGLSIMLRDKLDEDAVTLALCAVFNCQGDRREFLREMEAECKAILKRIGVAFPCERYVFLRIEHYCGCAVDYATADDVPLENVMCEHGNPLIAWPAD